MPKLSRAVCGVKLQGAPAASVIHGLEDGDGERVWQLPLLAELQADVGDLESAAQGHHQSPVSPRPLPHPAGQVVGIVEVCESAGIFLNPTPGITGLSWDTVRGVDEL